MEKSPDDEMSRSEKIKFASGLGVAALGGVVEVLGIRYGSKPIAVGSVAEMLVGVSYALKQIPESDKKFLGDTLGFPIIRRSKNT